MLVTHQHPGLNHWYYVWEGGQFTIFFLAFHMCKKNQCGHSLSRGSYVVPGSGGFFFLLCSQRSSKAQKDQVTHRWTYVF